MPVTLSGRSIFVASPGNLATERDLIRTTIQDFNELRAQPAGVTFLTRAWEQVAGGLGRPQDLINPELDASDFMILMLGDHWGQEPARQGPYSSGTEEEFNRGLELLSRSDVNLRDLLILFQTIDPDRLRDPGPQLSKVLAFRDEIERSKEFMYGVWDDPQSLRQAVEKTLGNWVVDLPPRSPKRIEWPPPGAKPGRIRPRVQFLSCLLRRVGSRKTGY